MPSRRRRPLRTRRRCGVSGSGHRAQCGELVGPREPYVARAGVGFEALQSAASRARLADDRARPPVALLEGDRLEELPDRETRPYSAPRRPSGGCDSCRSSCRRRRRWSARRGRARRSSCIRSRYHRGSAVWISTCSKAYAIGGGERLLVGVDDDDLAVVLPRARRDLRGRQGLELHGDLAQRLLRERLRRRHETAGDAGRARPGRAGRRRRSPGRPSRRRRPGSPSGRRRGRCPPSRTGGASPRRRTRSPAPRGSRRVDGLRPERERRRQRLDAAEAVDLVGAREMHGRDGGVGHAPVERRRTRRDALHACDLRRDDAHVRRRDHRVAAAGHVRADARDGDVPVAEPHARQRLHLEVGHVARWARANVRTCSWPNAMSSSTWAGTAIEARRRSRRRRAGRRPRLPAVETRRVVAARLRLRRRRRRRRSRRRPSRRQRRRTRACGRVWGS